MKDNVESTKEATPYKRTPTKADVESTKEATPYKGTPSKADVESTKEATPYKGRPSKGTPSKASVESAKEAKVGDNNFSNAASDDDSSDAGVTLGNLATPHTTSTMESNVSSSEYIEVNNESFLTVSERNIYVTFLFIGGIAVNEASVDLSLCNVGADYTLS